MKRTDFAEFKAAFEEWQLKLGLSAYSVVFLNATLGDNAEGTPIMATIDVDPTALEAEVSLTSEPCNDPATMAKHEAIHLLLARLMYLAEQRHTSSRELRDEEELIVCKLTKLL